MKIDELINKYKFPTANTSDGKIFMISEQSLIDIIKEYNNQNDSNIIVKNKKSGKLYDIIDNNVINATNINDDQQMVLYKGERKNSNEIGTFVREFNEFNDKFEIDSKTVAKNLNISVEDYKKMRSYDDGGCSTRMNND